MLKKYSAALVLLTAGCIALVHAQRPEGIRPSVYAHVDAKPINEMSGIVKSPGRDNVFWVHNDSGDTARIFAINAEGKTILPTYSKFSYYGEVPEKGKEQWQGFPVLDATNVDWEDIAVDENYLYLADMGNNGNSRRDLAIYLVSEIDPTASTRTAVIQRLPIVYPDQHDFPPAERHFDSESLFTADGKLYLITKHRAGMFENAEAGAKLYRLDTQFTDQDNVLTLVDRNSEIMSATGADVSPDGQTLAVLSYSALWFFAKPASDDLWLSAPAEQVPLDRGAIKQAEAVTWVDNDTLLVTNEGGDIFRLQRSQLPRSPLKSR
ncbi:MAG: hypothetical protein V4628_05045 [Pseudomonadota bacterium]